MTNSLKIPKG